MISDVLPSIQVLLVRILFERAQPIIFPGSPVDRRFNRALWARGPCCPSKTCSVNVNADYSSSLGIVLSSDNIAPDTLVNHAL